jgi:glucan phosphoethanolaminetransferase (alkaline phosphatase superfamily)
VRHHPIVRVGLVLILFRLAGLTHRYLIQPDVSVARRMELFVPAVAMHGAVLTAIVVAALLIVHVWPRRRRLVTALACALFAVLMIAGQADLTVSSITGAPLTPTVFRTFRGLQVVTSNEFLEPLRANWRTTAVGTMAFVLIVMWIVRLVAVDGQRAATPSLRRLLTTMTVCGAAVWIVTSATAASGAVPPPVEMAFTREWLRLDATPLPASESQVIAQLRELAGLPAGAAWAGDDYPLVYVPARRATPPRPLPDIVVVMVESLRAEDLRLITGRGETVTPHLDALASRSVVFSSYLSNAFPSAPSVLSFHASAWPHRRKEIITDFTSTRFDSMPERLRMLGYETMYVGADPHFDNQDRWLSEWYAGVRDLVASGTQATDRNIIGRAIAEIRRHDQDGSGHPLFAFVSTYSTHYPFRLPADAGETPLGSDADLPSRYRQVLRYTDQQLGALLQMLEARDRRDDTITVVVGDHSFYTNLRRTSGLPSNDNEWTAAIIHGPSDLIGPPRTVADVASHVDMLPTVLGLVGDDRPTAAVGSNLFGPPRRGQRAALAVRPGGIRFDQSGYSVIVDARAPNGAEISRFASSSAAASRRDLPTASQLLEWVDGWSYLIEHDRVWNPAFLRKSTESAGR